MQTYLEVTESSRNVDYEICNFNLLVLQSASTLPVSAQQPGQAGRNRALYCDHSVFQKRLCDIWPRNWEEGLGGGRTMQLPHRVFKCLGEISCGPDNSDYIAVKTVITIVSNITLPSNVSHGEYY